jgi:hypothetical protein
MAVIRGANPRSSALTSAEASLQSSSHREILAFLILRPGVGAHRPWGVVQPTEIKIAPEISGPLLRFAIAPGRSVRQGDMLVELSNPELEAGLVLAQAQLGQTRALRDRGLQLPLRSNFVVETPAEGQNRAAILGIRGVLV